MGQLPQRLYIANRGEIARRITHTAHSLGIETVVGYSRADAELPFVTEASQALQLDESNPLRPYLDPDLIIEAALESGCDSLHPGYGFLSESSDFATRVIEAGITWVGPSPQIIALMGDKIAARKFAASVGVPVGSGSLRPISDFSDATSEAAKIGYPVMIKAAGGGGGIGMSIVKSEDELEKSFTTTADRAARLFASPEVYMERYIDSARHIEVQILGTADGKILVLGDRDCSVQRRHQKVIEEAPAWGLNDDLRAQLHKAAHDLAEAANYRNAGTVEFLVDTHRQDFVFLEMNTRLQVEHRVTELVTGIDIVAEQLRTASGIAPSIDVEDLPIRGHAIEIRVYAEDPVRFFPSPGVITDLEEPNGIGVHIDAGYVQGNTVSPHYDPMIAKLCVHGETRADAINASKTAVDEYRVVGIKTNLPLVTNVLEDSRFVAGTYDTSLVEQVLAKNNNKEGVQTHV